MRTMSGILQLATEPVRRSIEVKESILEDDYLMEIVHEAGANSDPVEAHAVGS